MRKWFINTITVLFFLFAAGASNAEVLVLVHGYLGDASSWEKSTINAQLQQAGWRHAGNLVWGPQGVRLFDMDTRPGNKRFYAVQIPSQAPLLIQASWLKGMLNSVERRNPGQKITLVGHSAGGVVGRLALVLYEKGNVSRLITIAAPHLGTDRAVQALQATNNGGMFGFLKEWVVRDTLGDGLYNTVRHSRGILSDLVPPHPGTLLYWLNMQTHPDIQYVSIVRSSGYRIQGDLLVPPVSQDMNRVPALAGKSVLLITTQGHELSPPDGELLVQLLKE